MSERLRESFAIEVEVVVESFSENEYGKVMNDVGNLAAREHQPHRRKLTRLSIQPSNMRQKLPCCACYGVGLYWVGFKWSTVYYIRLADKQRD